MKCVTKKSGSGSLNDVMATVCNIADQQAGFVSEMFSVVGESAGKLLRGALQEISAQKTSQCCDIPEPCWMPLEISEIHCNVCKGGQGTARLQITNEDFRPHSYNLAATGADAANVSFDVSSFTLGPKERRYINVKFAADTPDEDNNCCHHHLEALIWVMGCRNHYLRWTLCVGKQHDSCCFNLSVNDTPDYVLHWYDHFYLPRQCFGSATVPKKNTTPEG